MKTNPNEPIRVNNGAWKDEMNRTYGGRGLTKREYFAANIPSSILQRFISEVDKEPMPEGLEVDHETIPMLIASMAVLYADCLIEELNKENNEPAKS